ncbi:MAG: methyltransferase [Marmoricola sp.]|nr:methyltransferase [Marmoricola sp.]
MSRMRSLASRAKGKIFYSQREELERLRALNDRLDSISRRMDKPRPGAKKAAPKPAGLPDDMDEAAKQIIGAVKPYTMTSPDKLFALITATRHLVRTGLEGAVVECGVWRGGSMHAVARTLLEGGVTDRDLYLFDTFSGMTEPTDRDRRGDRTAADMLASAAKEEWVWAVASREDVEQGLATLDYPGERFHLVEGPVEETIPGSAPDTIALLRLDTDWYESTKHELDHLYDRLVPGGVLIIDDYGSWQGSKEATDEYMARLSNPPMMVRAGRGRIGIKPS